MAAIALDNLLTAYYGGKQIALHRISCREKDMVVNACHYLRLTVKPSFGSENILLDGDNVIGFPIQSHDLSRYDEVLYE